MKYYIGVDTCDSEKSTYCVMKENKTVVEINSLSDEKEFRERVEELSKHYNAEVLVENEAVISDLNKKHKHVHLPRLSDAIIKEYFKEWLYENRNRPK